MVGGIAHDKRFGVRGKAGCDRCYVGKGVFKGLGMGMGKGRAFGLPLLFAHRSGFDCRGVGMKGLEGMNGLEGMKGVNGMDAPMGRSS